jgi:hypothetical protein
MAIRDILLHLTLAVFIGAGCGSPGSGAAELDSVKAPPPAASPARESKEIVRWKKPDLAERSGIPLAQQGVVVALMRWGVTTLAVFDVGSAKMIPLATKETGALMVSQRANRLAYLVREGANPAKNHIEILDWRNGRTLVVEPVDDDAVLGFVFDLEGKQLGYAAMNLRNSRSTHVTWRVGLLDLERQGARIAVDSASDKIHEEGVPVPFEWSRRTGRIYLQAWSPFRGMIRQSIWGINPERGDPIKILPAANYVGTPRLAPDGTRLAYLSSDMGSLPPDYVAVPGAPPGNRLSVMDLTTGEEATWSRGGEHTYGAYTWSASGEEIVAVEQAWLKGRFRDAEIRRIGKGTSLSLAKIDQSQTVKQVASVLECRDRNLFWVETDQASAKLYANQERSPQVLFEFPNGALQLLGCSNR